MDNLNPILLQKQVRDNAEEYANFIKDLKNFESEMKKKESKLQNEQPGAGDACMPPVRKGKKKSAKTCNDEKAVPSSASKKISGFDYASWDRFDVDKACADVQADSETSDEEEEEEVEEEVEERAREEAVYEKERGNRFVQSKEWNEAIQCYSRAIECYPYDAIYFANRALCYLKTNNLEGANSDCTASLALDGDYVKAYQRRAAARVGLGQFVEAREDLLKVMELEPMNIASKTELIKVEKMIKVEKPIQQDESKHSASLSTAPAVKMSWGSEDGVKLVQPIHKPPHLRSKKPMQRIEIEEVGRTLSSDLPSEPSKPEVNPEKEEPRPVESRVQDPEIAPKSSGQIDDIEEQVPPLPVSSVEFLVGWRKVAHNSKLAFMYLKQIPGLDLPTIFQESLEPSTFSDIIRILGTEFVQQAEPVYSYLVGISRVRRLSALTMFMSSADIANMKTLLSYCVASKQCSADEADFLRDKYELP